MQTLKGIRTQQIVDRERDRILNRERKIAEEQLEILRAQKLIEEEEENKRLQKEKIKAQQVRVLLHFLTFRSQQFIIIHFEGLHIC